MRIQRKKSDARPSHSKEVRETLFVKLPGGDSKGEIMTGTKSGFRGKLIVAFVLCAFLVAALVLARQEQQARAASEGAHQLLDQVIAAGETLTDEQVHERLGRSPDKVRQLSGRTAWRKSIAGLETWVRPSSTSTTSPRQRS